MENFKNQKKIYIVITCVIALAFIIVLYIIDKNSSENYNYLELEISETKEEENESTYEEYTEGTIIYIHITGEVQNPGVIIAKEGDRIQDIIEKAGGTTELANIEKVNLAYQVSDGQKIRIPSIYDTDEETENYITDTSGENVVLDGTDSTKSSKININTATQTELETLTGIGPSTAAKIIEYRTQNGKFKTIEDIKNVSGIGDAKFENIKDDITV